MYKPHGLAVAALLAFGSWLIPLTPGQELPGTMTGVTTRVIEPAANPGSFAAQPRTVWRAGTTYARIAESPDPENHIQGLVIIRKPDVWVVNLFNKSAKHIVDSDPLFRVQLPIFPKPKEGGTTKLDDLEFGRETEFFAKSGAKELPSEVLAGKVSTRYELVVDGARAVLWIDPRSGNPVRLMLVRGGEAETIEYLSFDEVPFDPSLFRPPSGVTIQDSK